MTVQGSSSGILSVNVAGLLPVIKQSCAVYEKEGGGAQPVVLAVVSSEPLCDW